MLVSFVCVHSQKGESASSSRVEAVVEDRVASPSRPTAEKELVETPPPEGPQEQEQRGEIASSSGGWLQEVESVLGKEVLVDAKKQREEKYGTVVSVFPIHSAQRFIMLWRVVGLGWISACWHGCFFFRGEVFLCHVGVSVCLPECVCCDEW